MWVHRVIDEDDLAFGHLDTALFPVDRNAHVTRSGLAPDLFEIALRDIEGDLHRIDTHDHHQRRRPGGIDQVPFLDRKATRSAADRGADLAVAELHPGHLHLGAIGLHGGGEGLHRGERLLVLLACDVFPFRERFETFPLRPCFQQLGLVAGQGGLCLIEGSARGSVIDAKQPLAFSYVLAFAKRYLLEHPVHLGAHLDPVLRLDGPYRLGDDRHRLHLRGDGLDRDFLLAPGLLDYGADRPIVTQPEIKPDNDDEQHPYQQYSLHDDGSKAPRACVRRARAVYQSNWDCIH